MKPKMIMLTIFSILFICIVSLIEYIDLNSNKPENLIFIAENGGSGFIISVLENNNGHWESFLNSTRIGHKNWIALADKLLFNTGMVHTNEELAGSLSTALDNQPEITLKIVDESHINSVCSFIDEINALHSDESTIYKQRIDKISTIKNPSLNHKIEMCLNSIKSRLK